MLKALFCQRRGKLLDAARSRLPLYLLVCGSVLSFTSPPLAGHAAEWEESSSTPTLFTRYNIYKYVCNELSDKTKADELQKIVGLDAFTRVYGPCAIDASLDEKDARAHQNIVMRFLSDIGLIARNLIARIARKTTSSNSVDIDQDQAVHAWANRRDIGHSVAERDWALLLMMYKHLDPEGYYLRTLEHYAQTHPDQTKD